MSKVLVTGCFGFIGQHLCRFLATKGRDVYGIGHSNFASSNDKFIVSDISIENLDKVSLLLGPGELEVYHLAGGASVGIAENDPLYNFDISVKNTHILLEWLRVKYPQSKLVIASSAAVYGANAGGILKETSAVSPCSIYGHHKYLIECIADMYSSKFDMSIVIARMFSVYGDGLRKQFFWDFCCKLSQAKNSSVIEVYGSGKEQRDWIHVSDVCNMLFNCCVKNSVPRIINIGTGVSNSVSDLVNLLLLSWGDESLTVKYNGITRKGDPFSLICDTKLQKLILDQPYIDLKTGVENYVRWFKNNE